MFRKNPGIFHVLAALALAGAGCGPVVEEPLARESAALDVCSETVPAERAVDGIPAYAQCDGSNSASIWSNDGVDTATSSLGSDWVRTQQGGGYQCTELAWRYLHFRWNIDYRHGDAKDWCDGMLPATLVKSTTPMHGDLIVFDGGSCGADATTGHIAVVDTTDAAKAKVTLVEENSAGRRSANISCALCFLHAVANDGTSGGAGATGGAGVGSGGSDAGAGRGSGGIGTNAGGAGHGGAPGAGGVGARGGASGAGGARSGTGGGAAGLGVAGLGGGVSGGMAGRVAMSSAGGVGSGGDSSVSAANGGQSGGGVGSAGRAGGAGASPEPERSGELPSAESTSGGCNIASRRAPRVVPWALLCSLGLVMRRRRPRSRARRAYYRPG